MWHWINHDRKRYYRANLQQDLSSNWTVIRACEPRAACTHILAVWTFIPKPYSGDTYPLDKGKSLKV